MEMAGALERSTRQAAEVAAAKARMVEKLRGGVIVNVTNLMEGNIAKDSGARAVAVVDTHAQGDVARMSHPRLVMEMKTIGIPVGANVRIGHFVEALILEDIGVHFVHESDQLTPVDEANPIIKRDLKVPFVSSCRNFSEALQRLWEGAAIISTSDENRTTDVGVTVRQVHSFTRDLLRLEKMDPDEVLSYSREINVPHGFLMNIKEKGMNVAYFASGVTTPADAALLMQLGCNGIILSSNVFNRKDAANHIRAIVNAVANYGNTEMLTNISINFN